MHNASEEGLPALADVFVVPQSLLMATGSLADQLTYPDVILTEDRTPAMEVEMKALLHIVGIDYLVDRWKVMPSSSPLAV